MIPELCGRGAWSRWSNNANLAKFTAWRSVGAGVIELDLTVGEHTVVARTGGCGCC